LELIKALHVTCVVLSISGFIGRGILMIRQPAMLHARWIKVSPHINDTVLLVSAILLASQWGWAALQLSWILAKIVALLVYITLGVIALRAGRSQSIRIAAWLAAIATFSYIVSVAITKNPLVFV
jgi:uncharacterized membrane protein SirB2